MSHITRILTPSFYSQQTLEIINSYYLKYHGKELEEELELLSRKELINRLRKYIIKEKINANIMSFVKQRSVTDSVNRYDESRLNEMQLRNMLKKAQTKQDELWDIIRKLQYNYDSLYQSIFSSNSSDIPNFNHVVNMYVEQNNIENYTKDNHTGKVTQQERLMSSSNNPLPTIYDMDIYTDHVQKSVQSKVLDIIDKEKWEEKQNDVICDIFNEVFYKT